MTNCITNNLFHNRTTNSFMRQMRYKTKPTTNNQFLFKTNSTTNNLYQLNPLLNQKHNRLSNSLRLLLTYDLLVLIFLCNKD